MSTTLLPIFWDPSNGADPYATPLRVSGIQDEYGGSNLYIAYCETSYYPSIVLVLADSFEDAYENAILYPLIAQDVRITEPDLEDYDPETLSYDADGHPVDTESLHIIPIKH